MPAYKDQHWLPSAYLKYFSVDQQDCTRKTLIWRLDGNTERCVPVESQCSANYFYSKEKPTETEQMFQINENAYCDCIDRMRKKRELVDRNIGDLLLSMFDFHLRNAAHKNQIGKEGIEAYSRRVCIFIGQILLGREDETITKLDIKHHLERLLADQNYFSAIWPPIRHIGSPFCLENARPSFNRHKNKTAFDCASNWSEVRGNWF